MRAFVLVLALALSACGGSSGTVAYEVTCTLVCAGDSSVTNPYLLCDDSGMGTEEVAKLQAVQCRGVLIGVGCAPQDAECRCSVSDSDSSCGD